MPTNEPSYAATLRRLERLGRLGVKFDLERLYPVLHRLGDPHQQILTIHIAGTNGKGSTAVMLAACLREAGLRTGLYTSPHLSRFTERIQVDGSEIGRERLPELLDQVVRVGPDLTFFETTTTMAFKHFVDEEVDVVVLETGLGGRLDATNVVTPSVSVLTHIGLDHTDILGDRLIDVAREKAGIVKPEVPVVCAPLAPEVAQMLVEHCARLRAPLSLMGREFGWRSSGYSGSTWRLPDLELGMTGQHQEQNAALCLATMEQLHQSGVLTVEPDKIRSALLRVRWPGRMEWVGDRYLLDGAHNPSATRALARSLGSEGPFVVVIGLLGHRNAHDLLAPLLPHCARVIVTRPKGPRGVAPERIVAQLDDIGPPVEVAADLPTALRLAGSARPVLVTGSLYLVGEAREILLNEPADPERTGDPLPPNG